MKHESRRGESLGGQAPGLSFLLFLCFLVLKLCGALDWSWWWVTCPLWSLPLGVVAVSICVFYIGGAVEMWRLFWGRAPDREEADE